MVVWIIGLAGAGKSTMAEELRNQLVEKHDHVVAILEGEVARDLLAEDVGFDEASRRRVAQFICRLSKFLESVGVLVICPVSGLYSDILTGNRTRYNEYIEVFVDVPLEEIYQRDQKQLYSRALRGEIENVVGVDVPFEKPKSSDIEIDNSSPLRSPRELAEPIYKAILNRIT